MPFIPIDSDLYPIDGAAHAVIPVRVFDGVQTTAEEAHAATAYAPVSQRQIAISTPSDVFRAIPILVAVDESTDFVRATLRYTSAIGAAASGDTIEIRLAVGSAIGSTTMLDVEATAESVTVEVAYASESARIVGGWCRAPQNEQPDQGVAVHVVAGGGVVGDTDEAGRRRRTPCAL